MRKIEPGRARYSRSLVTVTAVIEGFTTKHPRTVCSSAWNQIPTARMSRQRACFTTCPFHTGKDVLHVNNAYPKLVDEKGVPHTQQNSPPQKSRRGQSKSPLGRHGFHLPRRSYLSLVNSSKVPQQAAVRASSAATARATSDSRCRREDELHHPN